MGWTAESTLFAPAAATAAFRFEYITGDSFTGGIVMDDVFVL